MARERGIPSGMAWDRIRQTIDSHSFRSAKPRCALYSGRLIQTGSFRDIKFYIQNGHNGTVIHRGMKYDPTIPPFLTIQNVNPLIVMAGNVQKLYPKQALSILFEVPT